MQEEKVPLRDWILLPLLSLFTMCLLAASTELIARKTFSVSNTSVARDCMTNDPSLGRRTIPNSVCWEKTGESQLTEYRFNSCGHRAGMDCGPKSPGTYRIVMIGSSVAMGAWVPRDRTFAALLPLELTRMTGRRVELYNESMEAQAPEGVARRFNEALAAKPDLVLWAITPWDVQNSVAGAAFPTDPGFMGRTRYRVKEALATKSVSKAVPDIIDAVHDLLDVTSTAVLIEHFLYQSQTQYVKSYMKNVDEDSGFLKAQPSETWLNCLQGFDDYAADIETRANSAGVPVVVVLLPHRAQAAMISMGDWPNGYGPYKLGDEIRSSVVSHGGIYIDILPGYRSLPNPEQGYFPKDGHPNANGHATISALLAEELTSGAVPALRIAPEPKAIVKKGK